jgi:cell division protein FtsW
MGLVAGLVALQPDLSTMAVIVVAGFVVFFLSGAHIGQLFVAGLMGGAVFWGLVTVYPHAHERLEAFLAGLRDPSLLPYHPLQALYALASGGLFGTGLGEGRVKFYLPAAHTDAVFAVIGGGTGAGRMPDRHRAVWRPGLARASASRCGHGTALGVCWRPG